LTLQGAFTPQGACISHLQPTPPGPQLAAVGPGLQGHSARECWAPARQDQPACRTVSGPAALGRFFQRFLIIIKKVKLAL